MYCGSVFSIYCGLVSSTVSLFLCIYGFLLDSVVMLLVFYVPASLVLLVMFAR